MVCKRIGIIAALTTLAGVTSIASAHPGHEAAASDFVTGILHPIMGADHVLAMVAVGMLAAQKGGKALWVLPAVFMGAMGAGGLMPLGILSPSAAEQGIAASLLILGLMLAAAVRMSPAASAGLVGLFALFHGAAHFAEMTPGGSVMAYAPGFLLATAALHGTGIGVGLLAGLVGTRPALRWAGAGIATFGVALGLGLA